MAVSISDGGYHQIMNDGIYLIRNGRIIKDKRKDKEDKISTQL